MLRRIFSAVAALSLAAAFTLASASPARAAALTISGKVTDSVSAGGVAGVCITVGVPGNFCFTTTNDVGDYFIDLGSLAAQPGQAWDLFFIKAGYTTQKQTVVVNGNETLNVSFVRDGTPISTAPPPPCVNFQPPGCAINSAPPVAAGPTFTVYLPNITRTLGGASGWHTPFIVQNVGTVSTTLTVKYYSFATGSLVATHGATVQPGRSFADEPNAATDLDDNTQYSVIVTSVGAPVVAVVNEHQGPGAGTEALSYSGAGSGSTTTYLPLVSDMMNGWLTTMIMQNVGTSPASITAVFLSLDGTKNATITKTAGIGQSAVIDPRGEASLAAGTEYTATITSTQPVAVVANNHHDLAGVTPAMGDSYNGVTPPGTTTYLPYVAKNTDGVSRNTRVIVQNTGTAAATPTFTLRPFGSSAFTSVQGTSVPAGGAFVFTPTVADGEYSLTVTGGTFAAIATTISSVTAMYYTGTSAAQAKLYMPNITRKLTLNAAVDPGWNTPILIQSATATSATLNWYRFSDGTLVTTQTVALTAEVTTRVDPAAVSGLADNNQYAVVLTTTGTVVSIVTELNLVGGDDAMIYKGFAAP